MRVGDDRPKLLVVESVETTTALDPYLSIRGLVKYSSLSANFLRLQLQDPLHPLPHYRVGAKILVRQSEFDAWMAKRRRVGTVDVDGIAGEMLSRLGRKR